MAALTLLRASLPAETEVRTPMTSTATAPKHAINLPKRLEGPMAWEGSRFADNEASYILNLTDEDVIEVNTALSAFQSRYIQGMLQCPS
jgi:hypothetical protein